MKGHTYSQRRPYPYTTTRGIWQERSALADALLPATGDSIWNTRRLVRAVKSWFRGLPPNWRPGQRRDQSQVVLP